MEKTTWLLDERIQDRLIYHGGDLAATAKARGHDVQLIGKTPGGQFLHIPQSIQGAVVLYGSHEFVKQARGPGLQPGGLGVNDRTQASAYMSNLPLDWFLNRDAVFMTWAMFKQRAREIFYEHDTNMLFIRPNSGFKTFAGQRVKFGTLDLDIVTLDRHSGVMDETMILVHKGLDIQGEFRFVIAGGRVVTGSEYRWDGRLDVRSDWPEECEILASKVAQHNWQVDIAYTCDIALLDEGVKVVELNGFSCAGLYACDLGKVVDAVSAAAHREWAGEDVL